MPPTECTMPTAGVRCRPLKFRGRVNNESHCLYNTAPLVQCRPLGRGKNAALEHAPPAYMKILDPPLRFTAMPLNTPELQNILPYLLKDLIFREGESVCRKSGSVQNTREMTIGSKILQGKANVRVTASGCARAQFKARIYIQTKCARPY